MKKHNMTIPDFPKRIVIELTSECNLSCAMCPRHYMKDTVGFMEAGLWKKLIDELVDSAPDTVVLPFWRGESLLHPQFVELLEYALDKALRVHISTNGHLVKGRSAAALARCDFVTFSIHTELGFLSAKKFIEFRSAGKPAIQISFVKGEKTVEKILDAVVSSSDLGRFDSVRLYDEHTKNGLFGKTGSSVKYSRTFCPKLLDTLAIACDGTISRCNHIWQTEKVLNMNEMSIRAAWNSAYLQQIRENYPDAYCAHCDQWPGHTLGEAWRLVGNKIKHSLYSPQGESNE